MEIINKINEKTPFKYDAGYFKYYRLEDGTHIVYQSLFIEEYPSGTDYDTINNYIYENLEIECESIVDCGDYWEIKHILDCDEDTKEGVRQILTIAEEIGLDNLINYDTD